MRGRRRRKPADDEMEIDEVVLNDDWTAKVTTPEVGRYKVYWSLHHDLVAIMNLSKDELQEMAEGLHAVAATLEEARVVDQPVNVTEGWRCPHCRMVYAPTVDSCPCSLGEDEAKALSGKFFPKAVEEGDDA